MSEDVGSVSVAVSLQNGTLARDVVITLQTLDGTAMGEFLLKSQHRYCPYHGVCEVTYNLHPKTYRWDGFCKYLHCDNYSVELLVFLISPAGIEYTHVSTNVTLNADISTGNVTIPILDDMEMTESVMFSVVLTSADPAVVLHPETANVTIEDDDCE